MWTPPPLIDQVPRPLILLEYAPPAPYELAEPVAQQRLLPDKSAELTGTASAAGTRASDSVVATVNERRCRCMWCLLISCRMTHGGSLHTVRTLPFSPSAHSSAARSHFAK